MMNPGVIVRARSARCAICGWHRLRPAQSRPISISPPRADLPARRSSCVGIGKCRKTDAGTMCPSYMATREEIHSTRGRAHLLFEALSGGFARRRLADDAIYDALDFACRARAARRECPPRWTWRRTRRSSWRSTTGAIAVRCTSRICSADPRGRARGRRRAGSGQRAVARAVVG